MEHPIITVFRPLLATKSVKEAVCDLPKHPVLMSPYFDNLLQEWANPLSAPKRTKAQQLIQLKALIAIWRYATDGIVPEGAQISI
jgi:hypothetical protein